MTRKEIFEAIEKERAYQNEKWGTEFDDRNTPNDWVTYICHYATNAAMRPTFPLKYACDVDIYRTQLLKAATLAIAALEALDRTSTPPQRHYDS